MIVESAVSELTAVVGTTRACAAAGRPRATHYRRLRPAAAKPTREPAPQPRALTADERSEALEVLHSERFIDAAPPTVYATLLDEGTYVASISTMYRILHAVNEVHERRRVAVHPPRVKPELVALAPNMVWSWDITKLLGPYKWTYYYLRDPRHLQPLRRRLDGGPRGERSVGRTGAGRLHHQAGHRPRPAGRPC